MYVFSSACSTLRVLSETLKIFFNNKKLFSSITIITLITYSILQLSNTFSTKSLLIDVIKQSSILDTSRDSSEYRKILTALGHDLISLIRIESIFLLVTFVLSKFFMTTTIIAADITYRKKPLSLKDVLSSATKSCIRPLITSFYVILFGIAYVFFVLTILVSIQLFFHGSVQHQAATIVLAALAVVFYIYLDIIWSFGVVISVIEEGCYGLDALGKARKFLKGVKRQWFALHLLYNLIVIFISHSFGYLTIKSQSQVTRTFIMLVQINSIYLATVVAWVAYTVFYYKCKKINGDEIESQENASYGKLTTTPLLSSDLP